MITVKNTTTRRPAMALPPESAPPSRARRPTREVVRRRLLDAALEVFAWRGFDAASLEQVAAAAGLSKGAIYSNFESKDDLFFAMMADQVLSRVETVRTAIALEATAPAGRQTLRDIGRLLTEAFINEREWQLVFLDFWRRAVRDDAVRAQFVSHRRTLRTAIGDRVQEALPGGSGVEGLTVDDVITIVLALCNGLAIERYLDRDAVSDDLFGRVLTALARPPHAYHSTLGDTPWASAESIGPSPRGLRPSAIGSTSTVSSRRSPRRPRAAQKP